jgi:hypothetical protein
MILSDADRNYVPTDWQPSSLPPIPSLNNQKGYREKGQPFFSSRKLADAG